MRINKFATLLVVALSIFSPLTSMAQEPTAPSTDVLAAKSYVSAKTLNLLNQTIIATRQDAKAVYALIGEMTKVADAAKDAKELDLQSVSNIIGKAKESKFHSMIIGVLAAIPVKAFPDAAIQIATTAVSALGEAPGVNTVKAIMLHIADVVPEPFALITPMRNAILALPNMQDEGTRIGISSYATSLATACPDNPANPPGTTTSVIDSFTRNSTNDYIAGDALLLPGDVPLNPNPVGPVPVSK